VPVDPRLLTVRRETANANCALESDNGHGQRSIEDRIPGFPLAVRCLCDSDVADECFGGDKGAIRRRRTDGVHAAVPRDLTTPVPAWLAQDVCFANDGGRGWWSPRAIATAACQRPRSSGRGCIRVAAVRPGDGSDTAGGRDHRCGTLVDGVNAFPVVDSAQVGSRYARNRPSGSPAPRVVGLRLPLPRPRGDEGVFAPATRRALTDSSLGRVDAVRRIRSSLQRPRWTPPPVRARRGHPRERQHFDG